MNKQTSRRDVLRLGALAVAELALVRVASCTPGSTRQGPGSPWLYTGGTEIDLGPGSWCWFSSPRLVVDGSGRLYAGSVTTGTGTEADGDIVVSTVDLARHQVVSRTVVGHTPDPDDHAHPSLSLPNGPHGRVQVAWSPHSGRPELGYVYGGMLGQSLAPITAPFTGSAYAAATVVAGERWILTRRGTPYSWQLLRYNGTTWDNLGDITAGVPSRYQAKPRPYHLVTSSGTALHLFVSTSNPSDCPGSSVYHGTVGADLKVRRTDGTVVGTVGSSPPPITTLTPVWDGHRSGGRDGRGWPVAASWADGQPTVVISTRDTYGPASMRVRGATSQLRYVWARQTANRTWNAEHLAWAGSELYPAQPDYSGLAALDPQDPFRVVVSTNVHPSSGAPLRSRADGRVHWELFEGHRSIIGAWAWSPVTSNSSADNLRPSIAAGGGHRALTWMRGSYPHYTAGDTHLRFEPPRPHPDREPRPSIRLASPLSESRRACQRTSDQGAWAELEPGRSRSRSWAPALRSSRSHQRALA